MGISVEEADVMAARIVERFKTIRKNVTNEISNELDKLNGYKLTVKQLEDILHVLLEFRGDIGTLDDHFWDYHHNG